MKARSNKGLDFSQLAKRVVDEATGNAPKREEPVSRPREAKAPKAVPAPEPDTRNPAAVALGKLGGKKGGPARARALSAKRRSEIAKKAAQKRWGARKKTPGKRA